jgi:hypothetical protein
MQIRSPGEWGTAWNSDISNVSDLECPSSTFTARFILLCNCAGPEDWPEELVVNQPHHPDHPCFFWTSIAAFLHPIVFQCLQEDCQDGGWRPLFASKAPLKEFNPEAPHCDKSLSLGHYWQAVCARLDALLVRHHILDHVCPAKFNTP